MPNNKQRFENRFSSVFPGCGRKHASVKNPGESIVGSTPNASFTKKRFHTHPIETNNFIESPLKQPGLCLLAGAKYNQIHKTFTVLDRRKLQESTKKSPTWGTYNKKKLTSLSKRENMHGLA